MYTGDAETSHHGYCCLDLLEENEEGKGILGRPKGVCLTSLISGEPLAS
jgi:hypothetical protein